MITICFTYFRSLTLAHLAAALYSVSRQDLSQVEEIVVVDNNTEDSAWSVQRTIEEAKLPVPVHLLSPKHGDPSKTHSWSTNVAVREAKTPIVLFTRADYLLDFSLVSKFAVAMDADAAGSTTFVSSYGYHLAGDIGAVEQTGWREAGVQQARSVGGSMIDYSDIDSGVWMAPRAAFEAVGGLDEGLTAWGHAQTHFQFKLHEAGVRFVILPEVLYVHPLHSAPRDIELAHRQLQDRGVDIRMLWNRYAGAKPY